MKRTESGKLIAKTAEKFNPYRLVSDEEFCTNMNLIIAYNQIIKGETKRRFIAS